MLDSVKIADIKSDNRIREEHGDIIALSDSIDEFGLIEPIILTTSESGETVLVAGGRRLEALKLLRERVLRQDKFSTKWLELKHGDAKAGFLWRSDLEHDPIRRKAIEIEENLRRKELTWQEQVLGKKQLLELMQNIHGVRSAGGTTRAERASGEATGFSLRKLSAMLGEDPAQTSRDLQVAEALKVLPSLSKADTKESARRQINILSTATSMAMAGAARLKSLASQASQVLSAKPATQQVDSTQMQSGPQVAPQPSASVSTCTDPAVATPPAAPIYWELFEGDFCDNATKVPRESVDLVYTDLPYGVGLSEMSKHGSAVIDYADDRATILGLLPDIGRESFRVLKPDRYAVFFFGFNYYGELCGALRGAGFKVNPVPVIWYKHTRSTENPNTRYANAYDAALVAMKGSPVLIRPGQTNLIDLPAIASVDRLQIAQQPVELVERFLRDMVVPGAHVVDWCAGAGTTGVACVKNKMFVTLFEKEPAAAAMCRARLRIL